ncbi:MAG: aspartate kinase [Capsulimonadales bacterium]|nr:aspartate kinase [Capsulimonadales bacterium]
MKILVQKFGGTSVDSEEHRAMAAGKVVRAVQAGWKVVVVVSAIGRAGAPYATDTLVRTLKDVDTNVAPALREMDLMMACGEIISTVVLAQTLRAKGFETIALTGGQAGILTDYEFGNARILSIDPSYIIRMLEAGRIVLVAGFQGVTTYGAITTLGRGGSDTTASALGAALKPHAGEVVVEIYTDVDGVKTADPRLVPDARRLDLATYEEVAEMAHMGAKVVHPRAAEIAHQYQIPLWVKSTFADAPGTRITFSEELAGVEEALRMRVTGVTHTGKIVYLRFSLPETEDEGQVWQDKAQIELALYKMLQDEGIPLYLNSTEGNAFSFAIAREHLPRLRGLVDGLAIPIAFGQQAAVNTPGKRGRVYLMGLGPHDRGFIAQRTMLERVSPYITMYEVQAEVTENCTVVSVIAARFRGVPGVMALVLETLADIGIPVYQTADSELSISVLIPEADVPRATRALHEVFLPALSE